MALIKKFRIKSFKKIKSIIEFDNVTLSYGNRIILDNISFIRGNPGWDIENNLIMNFLDNVFDLQNYFERNKIPYVMYNSLPNDFNSDIVDFDIIKNCINMDRFFNPKVRHFEFIADKNLIVSPNDPHPSTEGHKQWAKLLKEFIDVNNLRTI